MFHDRVAALIWSLLGWFLFIGWALFELEAYTYWFYQPHITQYVRNWTWGHWLIAVFVAVGLIAGVSAMVTHFVIDGNQP